jgi:hypothetical protein
MKVRQNAEFQPRSQYDKQARDQQHHQVLGQLVHLPDGNILAIGQGDPQHGHRHQSRFRLQRVGQGKHAASPGQKGHAL